MKTWHPYASQGAAGGCHFLKGSEQGDKKAEENAMSHPGFCGVDDSATDDSGRGAFAV